MLIIYPVYLMVLFDACIQLYPVSGVKQIFLISPEDSVTGNNKSLLGITDLAAALDKVPAGITIVDLEGRILYYNEYCTRFVDRKPEYIGKDIRLCHKKETSIEKIDAIFTEMKAGRLQEFYYEAERGEKKLGVTVCPLEVDGKKIGFIHCFSIIR